MPQEIIDADTPARAYVYHGEWVADCPRHGCNNVEHLFRPLRPKGPRVQKVDFFACSYCGWQAFIDWPARMLDISQVLAQRPVPDTRNWYPQDHPVAVQFGVEHGQTVRQLIEESEANGVVPGGN
jgi:hypothetical protein